MSKRRQNGEGTIYQRTNGLWVCEITLGYDKDKKRIKKTLSSMDLDKLKKKINEMKYLNDRHMVAEPSKYIVSEWIEFWLDTYKKKTIKPGTYDMYYGALERYIKPQIGHYKMDALSPITIQKFVNTLSEKSLGTKEGLSESSIKKILLTLSQSYDKAVSLGIMHHNPCVGIVIPKKEKREATAFTVAEQETFLSICGSESVFDHLFVFAFNTGMRLGELMALTWGDIVDDTIFVSKNLSVVNDYENPDKKSKTIISTTKTESGTRKIPLNKKAREVVERQKVNNKETSPFVFYSSVGTPLTKRSIYRVFNQKLKTSEIGTKLTFHSIRHSFATRLLEKGADIKTVSSLLGHKSIQITLDIYSHVSQDLKSKTISLLDD